MPFSDFYVFLAVVTRFLKLKRRFEKEPRESPFGVKEAQEVVDVDEEETKRRRLVAVSKDFSSAHRRGFLACPVSCWICLQSLVA